MSRQSSSSGFWSQASQGEDGSARVLQSHVSCWHTAGYAGVNTEVRKGASRSNNPKVILWSEAWQHTDSEPQEVQTYYLTLTQSCKTQGACLTFIRTSEQQGFCAINPKEYLSVQTNCFCSLVHQDGVKKHYKSLMAISWKKHLLWGLGTSPPPPDLFPHLPHQWWINQYLMLSPLWNCWS